MKPRSNQYNSWTWLYTKGNDLMKQESWTSNVTQRRRRLDNFYIDLHATHNPSSTVSLRGEIIRYAKNNNNLDTFVEKKDFFMEKLSARGYNNTELSKADSSINFEGRQHFIKEKPKSTSIPLVFKTKYNPHFTGKYIILDRLFSNTGMSSKRT